MEEGQEVVVMEEGQEVAVIGVGWAVEMLDHYRIQ